MCNEYQRYGAIRGHYAQTGYPGYANKTDGINPYLNSKQFFKERYLQGLDLLSF